MSYIKFLPEILESFGDDDITIEKAAELLGYELMQKEAEEEIILEGILALDKILKSMQQRK
jgi:hypothetical protein